MGPLSPLALPRPWSPTLTEPRFPLTPPKWLLPSLPMLLLVDLSTQLPTLNTPLLATPTLTLSVFPELSLLTLTELLSPLTLLRSTPPKLPMPLLVEPSTPWDTTASPTPPDSSLT